MSYVLKNIMKWISLLSSCKFQGCIVFSIKSSGQKPSMLCILKSIQNSKCYLGISCERVFSLTSLDALKCRTWLLRADSQAFIFMSIQLLLLLVTCRSFFECKRSSNLYQHWKRWSTTCFPSTREEKGKMLWDPSNASLITPRSEEINGLIGTDHTAANL